MLTIGERTYARDDFLAWQPDAADALLDDNARAALAFCRTWLAGQAEFAVQTSGSTGATATAC